MIKKRIIFTLLFSNNYFYLSRNFQLQKIGDFDWLMKNYNFDKISNSVDEIILLDVSRKNKNKKNFLKMLDEISKYCLIPISAGGGINDLNYSSELIRKGADKIILNSTIFEKPSIVKQISKKIGKQAIIASIDCKTIKSNHMVFINNGSKCTNLNIKDYLNKVKKMNIGEILVNSIDRDGTGQGFDNKLINNIPFVEVPLIVSGGAGKEEHFRDILKKEKVSALSTSNLLNFLGNTLSNIRNNLIKKNYNLPNWE